MQYLVKEKTGGFIGKYRVRKAKLEKPEHFALNDEITKARDTGKFELMKQLISQLHKVCKVETLYYENLVPTVGRTMIANNLTDATPTNTMLITHAALGSSGTTPANGDTTLGTEVYRNAIASLTNASNIGYATAFYNATETSGTYAEAGIFSNGTGAADSGILLSHVLISVTKSTSETLTIDWELTIT